MGELVPYIITAAVALVTGIYGSRVARTNARETAAAQSSGLLLTSRDSLIDNLQEEVARHGEQLRRLEARIETLETERRTLISYVYKLWALLRSHGIPIPEPPDHLKL